MNRRSLPAGKSESPLSQSIENLSAELDALRERLCEVQRENSLLKEKLTAALDGTGLCIWQGEPQTGKLTVFNLQDFKEGEMAPHFDAWLAKLHPQDRDAALASYHDHLAGKAPFYEAEYRTFRPDGGATWLWDRGRVVEWDAHGAPVRIMGAHTDITRRKEYEHRLSHLAHVDPLTGLGNRRDLSERLAQETVRANRHNSVFALAVLDVDHFKQFNDRYGHDLGDRILSEMARAIEGELRQYDLCGRWGGEEFLLVLPATRFDEALAVVNRVHQAIARRTLVSNGENLSITASVGLAEYRLGEEFAETIRRADKALLAAKRAGRNRILCAEAG